MADIFLLFLAVYDYSAISMVISGSGLAEPDMPDTHKPDRQVCVLQKAAASVRDAAGERDTNQIKGRLKLQLIWEKCPKASRDHRSEPCHPARVFEGIWSEPAVEPYYTNLSNMPWNSPWKDICYVIWQGNNIDYRALKKVVLTYLMYCWEHIFMPT